MSCNYIKLSLFSIVLCIFIITHKLCLEKIPHNKRNMVDILNARHKRLLSESEDEYIFKTHSGENSSTQPIDNKSHENITEYHKTSSSFRLNEEYPQNHNYESEQIKWENEKNNKLLLQKLRKKSHYRNIKIIFITALSMMEFPVLPMLYIKYYIHK
ncbi:hypothetical protein PFUGPA_00149 [Plasmodium falciparum Palo Alto/Uganda]|uniref:Uncharacterized protein n=4 Tax=Plasmodium falciparum TaxID=5833 RepID=A0A024WEC0_PLAFA|nr:hypothetical protein PFTANZ_00179 [Plasmodium falciparum Tanzania (2000708)]ETW57699.1 hypothetical protein PFUGPA_00149 [Plasmodium falciparum Palo Alto/Uganda]EUR81797.1 hypothetical protein PFBG_00177 [Plasmodium falciparum 7G8]